MSNTTDERLIEAIRKNDYVSYNKLFERYYGRLCQYVYSLLMDKSDTEDIVQELFLNIWKGLKSKKMLADIFIRWLNIWH